MRLKILLFSIISLAIQEGRSQKTAPEPVYPIPSEAQMKWHRMEMNAFIHFTTNTFTDKEWGYGDESPEIFKPESLDAGQWARILSETGFKTMILTCKHHDGFCLWPSKYTEHSVAASPYKNGQGDIVQEASDACQKYGLKFGVYLSPWDRNHPEYGKPAYILYYRKQLRELFSNYGPIFEMWFDGANGGDGYYGGANEKRKIDGSRYYNWPETLDMINSLQENVIFFSDAGPGVRWVGNERGVAGETNWNTISIDTLFAGQAGITSLLNTGAENGTSWVPAEVDVSIRPGWFYHESENDKVKSGEQLFDIYMTSVGRGSTLLLNVPPDRRGLFHENDVKALKDFKNLLDTRFSNDLAWGIKPKAKETRGKNFGPKNLTDGNFDTYWAAKDGKNKASIELKLPAPKILQYISLQEFIPLGQRVKAFVVKAKVNGKWETVAEGTTIGYKRILPLNGIETNHIKLEISDSKAPPVLASFSLF